MIKLTLFSRPYCAVADQSDVTAECGHRITFQAFAVLPRHSRQPNYYQERILECKRTHLGGVIPQGVLKFALP